MFDWMANISLLPDCTHFSTCDLSKSKCYSWLSFQYTINEKFEFGYEIRKEAFCAWNAYIFRFVKCNTICETGHYGSECSSVCYCEHGSCDPHTGGCLCSRGFSGPKCDIPCSPGFYGVNCRQACPPCNSSKCSITLIIAITVTSWHVVMTTCHVLVM